MRFKVTYRNVDGEEKVFYVRAKSKSKACQVANRELDLRYEDREDEMPDHYAIVTAVE